MSKRRDKGEQDGQEPEVFLVQTRARLGSTKCTPLIEDQIFELMSGGLSVFMAAAKLGLCRDTITRWLNHAKQGDPEYQRLLQLVQVGRELGKIEFVETLKRGSHIDPASIRFLLERMFADEFGPKLHITNQIQSELERLLDVAARVLTREVFEVLLRAIAAETSSGAAQEISG